MEGASMTKDLLQPGDWMCSLDLKDAYLTVPIAKEHHKYLHFLWDGKVYEFTCHPFGLYSTPRVFTKLLHPVMAHLRSQGLKTIIYLDDILVMHQSKEALCMEVERMSNLLEALGFTINQPKSQTIPAQQIQFLGFLVDSNLMKLLLPQEKVQSIAQSCQWLMKQSTVTIRQLFQLLGRMTAAASAVLSAPIQYRHLQYLKIQSLKQLKSFDWWVTLDEKTVEELQWWSVHLATWNGKDII